jgi:sulfur carrier protein
MRVMLNGEARDLRHGVTVHDLVRDLDLTQRRIAVEVNSTILPQDAYAHRTLQEGDVVEIVHFIGGG